MALECVVVDVAAAASLAFVVDAVVAAVWVPHVCVWHGTDAARKADAAGGSLLPQLLPQLLRATKAIVGPTEN